MPQKFIVAAFDTETDPFQRGADIKPFVWGVARTSESGVFDFDHYWGDDCIQKFIDWIGTLEEPHCFYAHNGGKFDFLFMLKFFAPDATVINGRITKARIGIHEFRDSFSILPVKLANMGGEEMKGDMDYMKMRRAVRNRHRAEIIEYLARDCRVLHRAVTSFQERFGNKLTMAGAAMAKLDAAIADDTGDDACTTLQKLKLSSDKAWETDAYWRKWYFGGRVQCMESGVIHDNVKVFDANSMYPDVMVRFEHPTGNRCVRQTDLDDRTDMVVVDCVSRGALPLRAKDGSLTFPEGRGVFHVTGIELRTAIELGMVDIQSVKLALRFPVKANFKAFVEPYYKLRMEAAAIGDDEAKLHYKLVLNSSYGRFSLNPEKLYQWRIMPAGQRPKEDDEWMPDDPRTWSVGFTGADVWFWRRPATNDEKRRAIRNVVTGASITGAARAMLMRAMHRSERPLYCDTDSVICRSMDMPMHATELGAWKTEASANESAIAGKKLYALFQDGAPIKHASKGVRLTPEQIRSVANGAKITWLAEAPTINIAGVATYMKREIRKRA